MLNKTVFDEFDALKAHIKMLQKVRYDLANPISSKRDFLINFHGGPTRLDVIKIFRNELKRIQKGLDHGSIIPNSGVENVHIINVVCGRGQN